jgi:hypothetical protein
VTETELTDLAHTMAQLKRLEPTNATVADLYYRLRREHREWTSLVARLPEDQHPQRLGQTIG